MDTDRLAARFEADRPRLHAVAYRLLGSASEADDAVQEAWLRLVPADADGRDDHATPHKAAGAVVLVGLWQDLPDEEIDAFLDDVRGSRKRDTGRAVEFDP